MARRVCPKCYTSYNILFGTPKDKERNFCKNCNSKLEIRKSDTQDFTNERLLHFHTQIEPILNKAKKDYKYMEIDTECELKKLKKIYKNLFV